MIRKVHERSNSLEHAIRESHRRARRDMKKDYIPELSEVRMVRRAPERPFALSEEDTDYVERCLRDVEAAFAIEAFPGVMFAQIPARALMRQFIDWWRGLEPEDEKQREAHAQLPSAIRLMDTVSSWMQERAQRR
jgi:hypothetical protein